MSRIDARTAENKTQSQFQGKHNPMKCNYKAITVTKQLKMNDVRTAFLKFGVIRRHKKKRGIIVLAGRPSVPPLRGGRFTTEMTAQTRARCGCDSFDRGSGHHPPLAFQIFISGKGRKNRNQSYESTVQSKGGVSDCRMHNNVMQPQLINREYQAILRIQKN